MNSTEDTWQVINEYFKSSRYFLTKHHLDSYNDFVHNKIFNTVQVLNPFIMVKNQDNGNIVHEVDIYIGGLSGEEIFINKPTIVEDNKPKPLYPNEARLKNITYQSDIYANIVVKYITKIKGKNDMIEEDIFKNIKIGSLPIMLHSCLCILNNQEPEVLQEMGECPYDQGGYFILDGKEKVIVAQERIATNRIFINKSKDIKYSYEGLIRCTSEENPLFPKTINLFVYADELSKMKSTSNKNTEDENKKELIEDDLNTRFPKVRNAITISIPNVSCKIPIFVLFRALGIESDKDILEYIVYNVEDPYNEQIIEFLRYSIVHANTCLSQQDAYDYLVNFIEYKHIDKLRHILLYDLFPNAGYTLKNKALFLGHIINKLVRVVLGASKESDRDSYIYKRVDISGFLIANLFRDYYNQFRNAARNKLDNEYLYGPWRQSAVIKSLVNKMNLTKIFRADIIADGLKKSLKGMWGRNMLEELQDLDLIKQGIVQDLSRISYLGTISHLRRVNTPLDPTAKIVEPHRLHPSQWGIMCPCESPDGGSIGLLKNMAIMCNITFDANSANIMTCLKDIGIVLLENSLVNTLNNATKILLNSNWIGITDKPVEIFTLLKLMKRNALINIFTSISWNIFNNEINILTEAGRCCRPLYVIDGDNIVIDNYKDYLYENKVDWLKLVKGKTIAGDNLNLLNVAYTNPFKLLKETDINTVIEILRKNQAPVEYVDVEETNTSLIAMYLDDVRKNTLNKYTHCELHPSTMFSVVTHCIPFADHNQAPRNIFSGAQGKQAIGCYATNFKNRIDTMSYVLHYPQKCLVNTRYMEYINCNKLPHGENLIVAICTYTGYNMEDSIIMNKSAVQRGMFNLTYFKNIIDMEDENKIDNEEFRFMNPLELANKGKLDKMKYGNYKKLDEFGLPKVNEYISENDVIIGKCKITNKFIDDNSVNSIFGAKKKVQAYEDKSMIADKTVSGIVDKVFVYENENKNKVCKLRFRKIRTPELGDKCCSRHAQKGVIGMLIPHENMPFTKDGIVPDIIINPHAIPSRMTIAHLLECLLGKVATCVGTTIDGTPFQNCNFDGLYNILEKNYGFNRHGNEVMYCGLSGNQMSSDIFIGPTYYERLKHMVGDKMNYRSSGPITLMTRQPTQGRGNGGGLRLGEMERDSLLSNGLLHFMNEAYITKSDGYEMILNNETGFVSNTTNMKNDVTLRLPFAMKQALHEIIGLGVKPILITNENEIEFEETYQDEEFYDVNEEEGEIGGGESDLI